MAKKKQKANVNQAPAPRNHAAAALADGRFRKQVIPNKRAYKRTDRKAAKANLKKDALAA